MTTLTWTAPEDVEVGSTALVPVRTQQAMIVVPCTVLDQRVVYGRVEYQVSPVNGQGATWIQENSFAADSTGAAVVSPAIQNRRRVMPPRKPKRIPTDQGATLDERIKAALES
jgi:hypothetical protein